MTDPRYASPVPPYGGGEGIQDHVPASGAGPALEGTVVGDAHGTRTPYGFGAAPFPGMPRRVVKQKSLLLAGLLAAIFPPIGMLYATFFGTIVMTFISVPVLLVTAGQGGAGLWPLCVVWAVWAAHRKNQRRLAWAAMGF